LLHGFGLIDFNKYCRNSFLMLNVKIIPIKAQIDANLNSKFSNFSFSKLNLKKWGIGGKG
tara:strand:- start:3203 stop:3382 length:180 start_codon:yes stop_codon:yes gene_type:complete